eukprot:TRINITY_DN14879_c0_g1_i1.p1 TRINITY_DN14879_c0_g1~~TRINITY_DN14879_c0_g1_i1.p1  ORF type:complete len:155 (-),score=27.60 TRINITY_DN14879_c0_g1_i1:10-474(-)
MVFNGETYGYVGSRKFAEDIMNFTCIKESNEGGIHHCKIPYASTLDFMNLKLENVSHWIELSQLGIRDDRQPTPIYLHSQNGMDPQDHLDGLNEGLDAERSDIVFKTPGENISLPGVPPSSLWSFINILNKTESDTKLNAIVLADHEAEYKNRY